MTMSSNRMTATPGLIGALIFGAALHLMSPGSSLANEPTLYETHLGNAKRGDPTAQTALGNMYHDGFGVRSDQKQALYWYREAAAQNYPQGLYQLAHEYSQGHGVPQDAEKAFELFLKAAEQGHAPSQYRVSRHYLSKTPQDTKTAFKWAIQSAENGHDRGQNLAAEFYEKGIAVEKSLKTAFELYSKAADQGHINSMVSAAGFMMHGQIGFDEDKLSRYLPPAAKADHPTAQLYLGALYLHGEVFEQDFKAAYQWLQKAAKKDNVLAQVMLGEMYAAHNVPGSEYDLVVAFGGTPLEELYRQKAYYWYQKAAENGNDIAKERLAEYTGSR